MLAFAEKIFSLLNALSYQSDGSLPMPEQGAGPAHFRRRCLRRWKAAYPKVSLKSGDRLPPERELAAELGVSWPLREAIQKLASKGMQDQAAGAAALKCHRPPGIDVFRPWQGMMGSYQNLREDMLSSAACSKRWWARRNGPPNAPPTPTCAAPEQAFAAMRPCWR